MKQIIILATNDLATDQRVLKVATVFEQNNFDVLLVGRKLKNSPALSISQKYKRLNLLSNRSAMFYAEFNLRVFFLLLFSKCTHILANDTDTLPAAFLGSKIKKAKLIFDAHELFPEVPELTNRPFVKKIWTKIEDILFPHLTTCYTVCDSIAVYYNQKYGLSMQVVRNIPILRHFDEKILNFGTKKIILYQGALNVGRGLEWMIDAMPLIDNAVLIIIGTGDIEAELKIQAENLSIGNKVVFLGRVEAADLYKFTPSADVGLCLLDAVGLSYQYALPNRIFDYLHAGVPVLATQFVEIEKIVSTYNTGVLIDHYEPEYIAEVLNELFQKQYNRSYFKELSHELCWENESLKLVDIIRNI